MDALLKLRRAGQGPLNDATLNFALVAALVGACGSRNGTQQQARVSTPTCLVSRTCSPATGLVASPCQPAAPPGFDAHQILLDSNAVGACAHRPCAWGRGGERPIQRLRLSTSYDAKTGRWTAQAISDTGHLLDGARPNPGVPMRGVAVHGAL